MRKTRWLPMALLLVSSTACYHQIVRTGRPAGTMVVEHWFVSTWLYGLVPAKPIDVRRECPAGVAIVDIGRSFVNGLIAFLTFGIYTPQHVKVTCAAPGSNSTRGAIELSLPANASEAESIDILSRAAELAVTSHVPVILHFQASARRSVE